MLASEVPTLVRVCPFSRLVEKYGTAERIIAASVRTNANINALGGAAFAGGVTVKARRVR